MRLISLTMLTVLLANAVGFAHEKTRAAAQLQRKLVLTRARANADDTEELQKQRGTCDLKVVLIDSDTGEPSPGLVRIVNADNGNALELSGEIHRAENWHSLDANAVVAVPRMKVRVEAVKGLETELATAEVDLSGKENATVKLTLDRFYDSRFRGLRSANTHIHLMNRTYEEALRYLRVVPQSDDLDLVFLSHLRRIPDERNYISNRIVEESFTGGSLRRLSEHGILYTNGEEHRHNFGRGGEGYGHVMLLDLQKLIRPVSIGPGIMREGTDGIPIQRGIKEARGDGATVIWCHNTFGFEDVPNWLAGLVHAQNIFDGGSHGTYKDSFYRYLDLGLKVPFSTGTDWSIYDFARVYVPIEEDELTSKEWLQSLQNGRSFITNGPLLELEAERGGIGDTIPLPGPNAVTFVGRGMGRLDFKGLELVYNGRVVKKVRAQRERGYHFADLRFSVEVSEPGWVALRIPLEAGKTELDRPLFAHTSPVYLTVGGKQLFREKVAREMIDEIKSNIEVIKEKGVFASDAEEEAVMSVHQAAITALEKRIDDNK